MPQESKSIWELYHSSELVLWRRGRIVLIAIGAFYFVTQGLVLSVEILSGNIERLLSLAIGVTFFWLLFYLIWIGVHWVRWIWGALNLIAGFFLLIWSWRDDNVFEFLGGGISLIIGSYLCLGPSVYFFAKHQREFVRWKEALLFGAVCVLALSSVGAAAFGLFAYRAEQLREACALADEASQHIYVDYDFDWIISHVTEHSLEKNGRARMEGSLAYTKEALGQAKGIKPATGVIQLRFKFPNTFLETAEATFEAETPAGPVRLGALLWNFRSRWEIEHVGWQYLPATDSKPSSVQR